MSLLKSLLVVPVVFAILANPLKAELILGTGTGALIGNDLTDLGNDGNEGAYNPPVDLGGFDAVFFANVEPGFGGGEFSFNVFDNQVGSGSAKSCCGSLPFPQIVGANFQSTLPADTAIQLTSFTLTSSNDTPARDPQVWRIEGSNDTTDGLDGTWTTIFNHASGGSDWTDRNQVIEYSEANGDTFLTDEAFTAFRLVTDATGATSGAFYALNEIEFFGNQVSTIVPEPTTIALWSLLGIGLVAFRRYRRK